MAMYWSAVILDYCLQDRQRALRAFQAFVQSHPGYTPFVEKAKQRIAVLSRLN